MGQQSKGEHADPAQPCSPVGMNLTPVRIKHTKEKRKVYTVRRHNRSPCLERQPGIKHRDKFIRLPGSFSHFGSNSDSIFWSRLLKCCNSLTSSQGHAVLYSLCFLDRDHCTMSCRDTSRPLQHMCYCTRLSHDSPSDLWLGA